MSEARSFKAVWMAAAADRALLPNSALREARRAAGIIKRVTCHSLRKAFATEAQQAGMDIRTIQALLGHADMNTTATHYLQVDLRGAFSPADVPTAQLQQVFSTTRREALALP